MNITHRMVSNFYRDDLANIKRSSANESFSERFTLINPLPDPIPFSGIYLGKEGVVTYMRKLNESLKIDVFELIDIWVKDRTAIITGKERSHFRHNLGQYEMEWIHVLRFDPEGRYELLREYNDTERMLAAYKADSTLTGTN